MSEQIVTFEAYSYRVSARFGSRCRVTVGEGMVSVTGPRLGLGVYRLWVAAQAVLLVLMVLALASALIFWNGWMLLGALVLLLCHLAVSGFGAGCLWEMQNLIAFLEGSSGETVEFPAGEVQDVRVGAGWARRGMGLLILPYVAGINSLAKGHAVSFIAPDGTPDGGVYALHLRTPEEAQALASLLGGEQPPAGT